MHCCEKITRRHAWFGFLPRKTNKIRLGFKPLLPRELNGTEVSLDPSTPGPGSGDGRSELHVMSPERDLRNSTSEDLKICWESLPER